jgi:putative spermidine/putrescine transport system substrate-binding protein
MTKLFKTAFLLTTMSIASVDAFADSSDGEALIGKSWEEITSMAKGGEVNWFMWGGSDTINQYVTEYVGGILKNEYDIELNRVGISDTAEAVNIVLSEKEAGVVDKGSVDMIWVNGENFRTMKQGGLAYCGYTDTLPNNKLVNWDNPAIAIDFGVPVDGCEVPWSKVQFSFAHNAATIENPPRSIGELIEWVKENPGQFSYPAPPDFNGAVFVRHVFYHAAGGVEQLFGDFDQEKFDEVATKTWKILLDMKPYL